MACKGLIKEESNNKMEEGGVSEDTMRKDLITYFQHIDAKLREKSFKIGVNIISNENDLLYDQTLKLLSEQICYIVNEKNLKIQMVLIQIIEILNDKLMLKFQDTEKMFVFNVFDKFLSSNNKKLKNRTKDILTKIISGNQSSFFEVLKGLLVKANPKMSKSLLFFILSNDSLVDLDEFGQIEEELNEFCIKNYGHRMREIKTGVLKLIQLSVTKFGEDFLSSISKLSTKDKGWCRFHKTLIFYSLKVTDKRLLKTLYNLILINT